MSFDNYKTLRMTMEENGINREDINLILKDLPSDASKEELPLLVRESIKRIYEPKNKKEPDFTGLIIPPDLFDNMKSDKHGK